MRADGDVPALVAVGWACAVVLDDIGSPIAVNREGIKDPAGRWHAAVGPLADGAGKAPASALGLRVRLRGRRDDAVA